MARTTSDPVSGPNSIPPDRMTPEARLGEIGRLLAAGIMRRIALKSTSLCSGNGDSFVDFRPRKSGSRRANRIRIRIGGKHED
jgi:hypothetical protein